MSEWRQETASDLQDAGRRIGAVLKTVKGEPTGTEVRSIWTAYLEIEKSIAFIKFDMDEENPGRFIRLKNYHVPDERQAIQFAQRNLTKGADNFLLGDFKQALRDLRESRNYLRALLREKRLKRARKARSK